ncbi:MAG TPA: hypothetical protein VD865_03290 [Stenotrophomonas sp.]|nr:hypothetical protein [Stenotrophomonas sp.]
MSARVWWLGGAAAIAVGIALVLALRTAAPRNDAPAVDAPLAASAPPTQASTAATTPATAGNDDAPPPWLRGDAATAPPPAATPAAAAEDPERARQMAALQQSVQGLVGVARQRSVASETYLRQALATLEQMHDPAITAQINLEAVRQNLEISIRMQQLTEQMQQVLAQPPSEQRQQRQDALMAQLRQLQGQLRSDVRATPAATVQ